MHDLGEITDLAVDTWRDHICAQDIDKLLLDCRQLGQEMVLLRGQ